MPVDKAALGKKIIGVYTLAIVVISIALFIPAGTLDYWQGWAYMIILLVPASIAIWHFYTSDPEFLEKRFSYREKEKEQKAIVGISYPIFIIAFLLPGLDRRFGWSQVPPELSIAAGVVVLLSYILIIYVLDTNRFASRTIQVEKGQTVISGGPYAIVRHPMYLGSMFLYLATPIALGSYWAFPPFALLLAVFVLRIMNEEKVLLRELPGYREYCQKTRYRLVPYIW